MKNRKKGVSLLELLLVVAVGGVLVVSGVGASVLINKNIKVSNSRQQILALRKEMARLYEFFPTVSTHTQLTSTLVANGAYRAVGIKVDDANNPLNPYEGGFTAWVSPSGGKNVYRIGFTNIPRAGCVELATLFLGDSTSDAVRVNNGATFVPATYTVSQAAASCNRDANEIHWGFF